MTASPARSGRCCRRAVAALALALALGLAGTSGTAQTRGTPNKRIQGMQQDAAKLIDLPDAAYGALDTRALDSLSKRLSDLVSQQVEAPENAAQARAMAPLLVVGSPRRVAAEATSQWPLLVGQQSSGWRAWAVSWRLNARVVMCDLQSGRVISDRLEGSEKRQRTPVPSMGRAAPNDFDAATLSTGVTAYRPFADLVMPDTVLPARYALTVIAFDWKSNTVVTTVSARAGAAPQIAARPAARPTPGIVLSPQPAAPGAPVMSLKAPARVEPGRPLPVSASLNLSVEEGAVISAGDAAAPARSPALLAVTAILLRRDAETPVVIPMWVPAQLQGPDGPAQRASATFTFDANQLHDTAELRGLFQLYLVAGRHTLGPHPVVLGDLDGPEALHAR